MISITMEICPAKWNNNSLSTALKNLVASGFLTREGSEGYRAVANMKIHVVAA